MRRQSGLINRQGGVAGLVNEYTGHDMIFPGQTGYTSRTTAPPGWLDANGAAISRTVYASLFNAIGTTYGAGDGSTTFNLPDLRGEFLRGLDKGRGVDTGRALGSSQKGTRVGCRVNANGLITEAEAGVVESMANRMTAEWVDEPVSAVGTAATGTTWASQTHYGGAARPRNVAQLAIIKY